jgi:hypothetical protein
MAFLFLVLAWSQNGCRDHPDATCRSLLGAADNVLFAGAAKKHHGIQKIIDGLGMTAEQARFTGRLPQAGEQTGKPVT